MRYHERLTAPALWWFGAVLLAGLAAAFIGAQIPNTLGWVALGTASLAIVLVPLARMSQVTIDIDESTLTAGPHRVALARIREATPFTSLAGALVPGAGAMTRPWLRAGVRVLTDDGLLVLSSRHPPRLAATLMDRSARPEERPSGTTP